MHDLLYCIAVQGRLKLPLSIFTYFFTVNWTVIMHTDPKKMFTMYIQIRNDGRYTYYSDSKYRYNQWYSNSENLENYFDTHHHVDILHLNSLNVMYTVHYGYMNILESQSSPFRGKGRFWFSYFKVFCLSFIERNAKCVLLLFLVFFWWYQFDVAWNLIYIPPLCYCSV